MPTNPQDLAIWFAGIVLVPVLIALYKAIKPKVITVTWANFVCSGVVAYIALALFGAIPWLPDIPKMPFSDPVALILSFTSFLAVIGEIGGKIFGLAVIVFEVINKAIAQPANAIIKKLGLGPGD